MIREDGYVKVLDFGLPKLTAEPEKEFNAQMSITSQPGLILGTSNYISPEQARGRDVDHRTDLFSLGVVIYEMLTGIQPFKGETAVDVVAEIIQSDPPPVERLDGKIPKKLSVLIKKLLEKDAKDRYQDAAVLRDDLIAIRDEIKGEPSWNGRLTDGELDIFEMPTSEFPVSNSLTTANTLYFLVLSIILLLLTAFVVYQRMH